MILLLAVLALQNPPPAPAAQEELAPQVSVAENAVFPHAAISPDGSLIAATFVRNGNIEVALSTDRGRTFRAPVIAMDVKGMARPGARRGPRIAVDGQKRLFIVAPLCFDAAEIAANRAVNELWVSTSGDLGKTYSPPVRINDAPKGARESLFSIALTPAGDLHVAWLDTREDKGPSLRHAKVSDHGRKAGKSTLVARNLCDDCAPAIAVDGKGNPALSWWPTAPPKSTRQPLWCSSANGGAAFSTPAPVTSAETNVTGCPNESPAVALSADGKTLALAWSDLRDIIRDPKLDRTVFWTVGTPPKLPAETPPSTTSFLGQARPALVFDPKGVPWCAWEEGRNGVQQVYAFDGGTRREIAVTLPDDAKGAFPTLAAGGGLVAVAYALGEGVAFRILAGK